MGGEGSYRVRGRVSERTGGGIQRAASFGRRKRKGRESRSRVFWDAFCVFWGERLVHIRPLHASTGSAGCSSAYSSSHIVRFLADVRQWTWDGPRRDVGQSMGLWLRQGKNFPKIDPFHRLNSLKVRSRDRTRRHPARSRPEAAERFGTPPSVYVSGTRAARGVCFGGAGE